MKTIPGAQQLPLPDIGDAGMKKTKIEDSYRCLFEEVNDPVFLAKDGKLVDCNAAALRIFGCGRNHMIGKPPHEFSPASQQDGSDSRKKSLANMAAALGGAPQVFQWRYARADGSEFDAEVRLRALALDGDAILQAIVRDIREIRPHKNHNYVHILREELPEEELDGIVLLTRDLEIAWASDNTVNAFREKAVNFIGRRCHQFRHHCSEPCDPCLVLRSFASGKRELAEYRHAEGGIVELQAFPISFDGKDYVLEINRNVTRNKKTDEALRQTDKILQSVFNMSPVGLCVMKDRVFQMTNAAYQDCVGYPDYELIGQTPRKLYESEDEYKRVGREFYANVLKQGMAATQTKQVRKDGAVRDVILTGAFLVSEDLPHTALIVVQDITGIKQTEEELRRKSIITDSMSELVILLDREMKMIWASPAMQKQFGLALQELEGKQCFNVLHGRSSPCRICPGVRAMESGAPCTVDDFSSFGKRWNMRAYPVRDENGNIQGVVEIVMDITDQKKAEDAVRESERKLSEIIEFLPDATFVIDREGKVIAWNKAIEAMTGITKCDMIGKGDREYALPFYGERRPILIDLALQPDRLMEDKYTAIQRTGDTLFGEAFTPALPPGNVHLSATASVLRDGMGGIIAAIECIRDNTERKKLEERLNRAEKMEVLGRLAGGVAHDLNNVLGVMVGYSELLQGELPAGSRARGFADKILNSSVKGAAIIQDLLTLARRVVTSSKVVDLNGLILDYLRTPEFEKLKSHHPGVKIWTELEGGLLNIKGSPIHLGKTIMNLVSNAAEAISDKGEVVVRTENRYLDKPIKGYDLMKEGDYVVLQVSDTGIGMSEDDIGKIFEPFYTKKVMGRSGTGLGLAVVWGTVKDHSGYIDVQSEIGKGSSFSLYFPVTREKPAKAEEPESLFAFMGRGESILVVDDVGDQRELAMNMLGKLGYKVAAVAGGEDAVEYLKSNKADLVILDMIMDPGIDGREAYKRILKINPAQKALIVSGFSETERVRKTLNMGAGAFVRKPYILENIGKAIRKELDRPDKQAGPGRRRRHD
jgi:PAS domain S-box-containing protein